LVWIQGEIEKQLLSTSPQLTITTGVARTLFRWHDNSNIFLSYSASDEIARLSPRFRTVKDLQAYFLTHVKRYDPVTLVKISDSWYIQHEDNIIAQIAKKPAKRLNRLKNPCHVMLYVADVFWKDYDPSNEYEVKHVSELIKPEGYWFPSVFGMVE